MFENVKEEVIGGVEIFASLEFDFIMSEGRYCLHLHDIIIFLSKELPRTAPDFFYNVFPQI